MNKRNGMMNTKANNRKRIRQSPITPSSIHTAPFISLHDPSSVPTTLWFPPPLVFGMNGIKAMARFLSVRDCRITLPGPVRDVTNIP